MATAWQDCTKPDDQGDEDAGEKIELLAEAAGAAASGHGTKLTAQKAIILLGREAENRKSQILDILRGLLPADAVCNVAPRALGNGNSKALLVGKLLNTSDELVVQT